MEHPDANSMAAFSRRTMGPVEMLRLSRHLAGCEDCRDTMESLAKNGKRNVGDAEWYPAENVVFHLSDDEIATAAVGRGSLDADAAAHLSTCDQCSRERDELRRLSPPVLVMKPKNPRRAPIGMYWAVWSGLAAAGLLVAAITLHRHPTVVPDSPVLVAMLQDDGGQIGINARGELQSPQQFPPADQVLLANTLTGHQLPVSHFAAPYSENPPGLRGGPSPVSSFKVQSPLSEETTDRPKFQWEALPEAESYRVEVHNQRYRLIAVSPTIKDTNWTPSQPLLAGNQYTWVVKAKTPHGIDQSPRPPEPEAEFTVADGQTLAAIDAARRQYPGSHLLLACLYARAGMPSMAHYEVDALEKENPGSSLVHDLANSLTNQAAKGQRLPSSSNPAQ